VLAIPVKLDIGNFTVAVFGYHEQNFSDLGGVDIFSVGRLLFMKKQYCQR